MPPQCVYILISVMDLLDKAVGSSAASGKKERDHGSTPAAAPVGTFQQQRTLGIMDPWFPPRWRCHSVFSSNWALGGVTAESACWKNRKLVSPIPRFLQVLSFLAPRQSLPGWDGACAPVHELHRRCILLSAHISPCKEVTHKSLSEEDTWAPSSQINTVGRMYWAVWET